MKKKLLILFTLALILVLGACSKDGKVNVGGIFSGDVEFTMTKTLCDSISFSQKTEEEIKQTANKAGYSFESVKKNDDGSISFKVKKGEIPKAQNSIKKSFAEGTKELMAIGDGKVFPHIKSMTASDDFQTCTVITTGDGPMLNDESLASYFFMCAAEYNAFSGDPFKEVKVEFKNEASGNVVNTVSSVKFWAEKNAQ